VVIRFPKAFYIITISQFLKAKDNAAKAKQKSLTENFARVIAEKILTVDKLPVNSPT